MLVTLLALIAAAAPVPATEAVPQVVPAAAQHAYEKNGIRVHMLVEDGDAYLGRLVFAPGAGVPPHRHAASEELLSVVRGAGELTIDGKPVRVKAGDAVRIPVNALHDFKAVGDAPVELMQVYSPRGPEARFRDWPAVPLPK